MKPKRDMTIDLLHNNSKFYDSESNIVGDISFEGTFRKPEDI